MTKRRRSDTQSQIDRLEFKHSQLSARVAELDGQLFLSAREQLVIAALKREKLAAKDAIADLRRMA
jgi:hypothetical protein